MKIEMIIVNKKGHFKAKGIYDGLLTLILPLVLGAGISQNSIELIETTCLRIMRSSQIVCSEALQLLPSLLQGEVLMGIKYGR